MKQAIRYVAKGDDTRHGCEIKMIYGSETTTLHDMKYGFTGDAVTFHHCGGLESSSSMLQCIEWCHEVSGGVILDVI